MFCCDESWEFSIEAQVKVIKVGQTTRCGLSWLKTLVNVISVHNEWGFLKISIVSADTVSFLSFVQLFTVTVLIRFFYNNKQYDYKPKYNSLLGAFFKTVIHVIN